MSDHLARRFGIGGRLISVVFNLFFIAIPTFTFCWFLEVNLYVTVVALFFSGFCLSFPRSGALTFAIEKVPGNAAGVSCSFTSLQFGLAFLGVSVAAYVYEHYGLMYFAYLTLPVYLLFGAANARLLYRYMTSYDVVDVNETEREFEKEEEVSKGGIGVGDNEIARGEKGELGQDIELRERSTDSATG